MALSNTTVISLYYWSEQASNIVSESEHMVRLFLLNILTEHELKCFYIFQYPELIIFPEKDHKHARRYFG